MRRPTDPPAPASSCWGTAWSTTSCRRSKPSWPRPTPRLSPTPRSAWASLGYWDVPEAGLVDGAGAEAWTTSYRAAVVEAAELLTATGARVIWIGAPWFADRSVPGVRRLNHVYREVAANLEHVQFVDVARRLSGSADEYRERDGTDVMRKPDGVHLCPDGAAIVAVAVAAKLGVPAPIGWESSGWRSDPRYFTAQGGSCPAA
jgi:hypothetical protein